MILSKNTKKILGIVFIIIFIILFIKLLCNKPKKDLFSDECSFRNNICKPLSLVDVNFVINKRITDSNTNTNTYTKDLIHNRGKFYTMDNKYYMVIEMNQPYSTGNNYKNDIDEIYQIKQSNSYIYALNKGMTQIRVSKKDISDKKFSNIFRNKFTKIDYENIENEKVKFITAFGVFNYKKDNVDEDYCVIVIKDYNINKSKLYIIKSKVRNLDLNNLVTNLNNDIETEYFLFEGDTNIEIRGNLYIKSLKITGVDNIIIYCNYKNEDETTSFSLGYMKFIISTDNEIVSNNTTNIVTNINLAIQLNNESYGLLNRRGETFNIDLTDLLPMLRNVRFLYNDFQYNYDKYNNLSDLDFYTNINNYGNGNVISNINSDIKPKLNYLNLDLLNDLGENKLITKKIKLYQKNLNSIVNGLLNHRDLGGIIDFNIEHNYIDTNKNLNIYYKVLNSNEIKYYIKKNRVDIASIESKILIPTNENINLLDDVPLSNRITLDNNIEDFINKLNDLKKQNFVLKKDNINLTSSNIKVIHPNSELITDVNRKPDLEDFYNTDVNNITSSISLNQHMVGIIEFDYEAYNNEKSPLKKDNIYQPRNAIFTLYRKVTNRKNKDKTLYGRINMNDVITVSHMAIPSFRFNKSSNNNKLSMYKFFIDKQREQEFTNINDWIYLYEVLKNQGFYHPNKNSRFEFNYKNIRDSFLNNNTIMDNGRFKPKHDKIFLGDQFKTVYDDENYDKYPNFYIGLEGGEKLDDENIKVKLILKYPLQLNDKQDHYIKLEKFDIDDTDTKITNTVKYNNKSYDYFKLETTSKEVYDLPTTTDDDKMKYKWYPKEITNFNEFAELILGKDIESEDIDNESFDRDRLRGIFELDKIFVDDYYINFLEKYKTSATTQSSKNLERINTIIQKKKAERDLYCILDENGEYKINKIGYPFYVFYKYIKYHNIECAQEDVDKNTQKLFLLNRITEKHLNQLDKYEKEYDKGEEFENYPFITQEFMSFTGVGNDVQFYLRQFGGTTSITSSEIGNCRLANFDYIDSCNDNLEDSETCGKRVLSYIYTDGSPRCEIDNPLVKRKNASPVETLLIGSSHINACNVWMRKGDKKIYYKLGKIFENSGKVRYQLKGMFTIQTTEPEYDGKYLVYKDNGIVLDDSPLDESTKEVKEEYIFEAKIETDNYGSYFLFSPKNNKNNYITQKVNIFNNKLGDNNLGEWILQDKINEKNDRNNRNNKYKSDIEYYSQKFNLPISLQRNIAANDGIEDEYTAEENRNFVRTQSVLNSLGSSELTIGDTSYSEEIDIEEEKRILEKELGYLNNYLKNLNNIPPREMENIDKLVDLLKRNIEDVKERIVIGNKRLESIKFIVLASNKAKNQESSLRAMDLSQTKNQNKNNFTRINMMDNNNNTQQMNFPSDSNHTKSLQEIRNVVGNRQINNQQRQRQCFNVPLEEGFANRSHYHSSSSNYNNHVVDNYYNHIKNKLNTAEQRLKTKSDKVKQSLDKVSDIAKAVKLEKGERQILLSQEIQNKNKLDMDIFKIKNYEQEERIKTIQDKFKEIEKLKCELGDIEDEEKEESQYKSIISHEDRELLNLYKVKKEEIGSDNEALNNNMILINGGCLTYNKESKKLDSQHCMINEPSQQFGIHKIEDVDDMKRFNLKNIHLGIDKKKPYYIVNIPKLRKDRHEKCGSDEEYMCLHKDGENNNLSLRNCNNIRNQKWAYSNVSKTCNK